MSKQPRTRAERQQPQTQYLTDQELKQELHKQAEIKRNEKRFQQLKEKEGTLQHYQNYKLGSGAPDEQFQTFMAVQQQNLQQEINETLTKHPQMLNQMAQVENHKEQERLKRLKLREEERLRRANGLASAYEDTREPLPFQLERQLKENININSNNRGREDLFAPVYKEPLYNELYSPQPEYQPIQNQASLPVQTSYTRFVSAEAPAADPMVFSQRRQSGVIPSVKSKQEQSQIEKERQRQYREELDQQINNKRQQDQALMQGNFKPYSQQSQRNQPQQDDFMSKFGAKPRQQQENYSRVRPDIERHADQVMDQLINKERGYPVSPTVGAPIAPPSSQYQREEQQRAQMQKQKYKEELDRQIQEKKQQQERNFQRRQSAQPYQQQQQQQYQEYSEEDRYEPQYQPQPRPPSLQSPMYQDQMEGPPMREQETRQNFARRVPFVLNDNEQIEKQKMQKQKYAEELKMQMEERERQKKLAQRQQMEHERAEQEKFHRAIEEEKLNIERAKEAKLRQEEEARLKQLQSKGSVDQYEHQIGYKTAAQKRREMMNANNNINTNYNEESRVPPTIESHRVGNMNIFDDEPERVFERSDTRQQQQYSQQSNPQINGTQFSPPRSQPYQNQMQTQPSQPYYHQQQQQQQYVPLTPQMQYPQFQPQQLMHQPQYIPQIPQIPQMNQMFSPFQAQQQYQPGLLFQQQPWGGNNLLDQISQYQNILFNPNMATPQPLAMQIHQNYLLQLQQNKHEIEMVRHILEEKLKIQQLEMQNQIIVEQYKTKVKDIQSEQQLFEKEINKLKNFLQDQTHKEPLNPQVFTSALYMSILGQKQIVQPQDIPQTKDNKLQFQNIEQKPQLQQPVVLHLMPPHAKPREVEQPEEVELPASSDYVAVEYDNNSIWNGLQVQQNKSFMPELQHSRQFQQQLHQSESQLQQYSVIEDANSREEASEFDVDDFDVNMLRTQDYMDMFKQNIQSQPREPFTNMLKENGHNLEKDINIQQYDQSMSQPTIKTHHSQTQMSQQQNSVHNSTVTNAISSFQSKLVQQPPIEQPQFHSSSSQLAMSSSIPLSQLKPAQEVQLSDAKFDQQSIILPEDDIDEGQLNNFIESNEEHIYEKIEKPETLQFIVDFNSRDVPRTPEVRASNQQVQLLNKPQTANNHPQTPSIRDGESSKKQFKKPKTFDIFSRLDQTQSSQIRPIKSPPVKHQDINSSVRSYKVNQLRQSIEGAKELEQKTLQPMTTNYPLPSNIYSNCTNLNPLTSQTFMTEKREQIIHRIDNLLSTLEQDQQQPPQSGLFQSKLQKPMSRRAKDLQSAQNHDREINELRESQELTPHQKEEYSMMFKYDESIANVKT